jgi:hypothetical protein
MENTTALNKTASDLVSDNVPTKLTHNYDCKTQWNRISASKGIKLDASAAQFTFEQSE